MDKELCSRCGKETDYGIQTPISARRYFIEGDGQLCAECYALLYGVSEAFGNKMRRANSCPIISSTDEKGSVGCEDEKE